jgi:hypothetical protein
LLQELFNRLQDPHKARFQLTETFLNIPPGKFHVNFPIVELLHYLRNFSELQSLEKDFIYDAMQKSVRFNRADFL